MRCIQSRNDCTEGRAGCDVPEVSERLCSRLHSDQSRRSAGLANLMMIFSLKFEQIRSILPSDRQHEANLQELRQISMVEKSIKLTVTVVREDIPSIQGIISLTYKKSSSQEAWGLFIRDVRAALDLDYIDCIMDIIDKSPVYMVDRLIPFATYLARQTEDSALMDALNDGGVPLTPSWQSVADIALVKQDLLLSRHFQERIDKKTTQILNMPMTRIEEYSISKKIIAAKTAVQILSHIKDIVKVSNDHYESKRISDMNRENTVSYDDHGLVISTVEVGDHDDTVPFIDLASLHRLAFESLGRRAVRYPKEIANGTFTQLQYT